MNKCIDCKEKRQHWGKDCNPDIKPSTPSPEDCKHEDVKLIGAIANTNLCFECKGELLANEIEIFNEYHEVGGFCNNEKCKRYMILVA